MDLSRSGDPPRRFGHGALHVASFVSFVRFVVSYVFVIFVVIGSGRVVRAMDRP